MFAVDGLRITTVFGPVGSTVSASDARTTSSGRTYPDDISVTIVQRLEIVLLASARAHVRHPEAGQLAEERTGVAREGVERRESVGEDGSDEGRQVEREALEEWTEGGRWGEALVERHAHDEGGWDEDREPVEGKGVRFIAAEDLMHDLVE